MNTLSLILIFQWHLQARDEKKYYSEKCFIRCRQCVGHRHLFILNSKGKYKCEISGLWANNGPHGKMPSSFNEIHHFVNIGYFKYKLVLSWVEVKGFQFGAIFCSIKPLSWFFQLSFGSTVINRLTAKCVLFRIATNFNYAASGNINYFIQEYFHSTFIWTKFLPTLQH